MPRRLCQGLVCAIVLVAAVTFTGFTGCDFLSAAKAASPLPTEAGVVAVIQDRGGSVDYDSRGHVTKVDLGECPTTNADLEVIAGLTNLKSLEIWGAEITDGGMESLAKLVGLETLVLENTDVTDTGALVLAKLPSLKVLNLRRSSNLSDASLVCVAQIRDWSNSCFSTTILPMRAWLTWNR